MIDPQDVRDGVTKQCAAINHACNGLMCGCWCHDQDHARLRDHVEGAQAGPAAATAAAATAPRRLTGAEVVRRLFGPTVLAGNLQAAAAEAEKILGEYELHVREQVVADISSASFGVAEGSYSEVLAGSRAAARVIEQIKTIVRGGLSALTQLPYLVPGIAATAEHLHALDCYRAARGQPPFLFAAAPGALPRIEEINRAVTWWNDGGHRGR